MNKRQNDSYTIKYKTCRYDSARTTAPSLSFMAEYDTPLTSPATMTLNGTDRVYLVGVRITTETPSTLHFHPLVEKQSSQVLHLRKELTNPEIYSREIKLDECDEDDCDDDDCDGEGGRLR